MTKVKDVQYKINQLMGYGNKIQLPYDNINGETRDGINNALKKHCDDVTLYTIYSAGDLLKEVAKDLQEQLNACEVDIKI